MSHKKTPPKLEKPASQRPQKTYERPPYSRYNDRIGTSTSDVVETVMVVNTKVRWVNKQPPKTSFKSFHSMMEEMVRPIKIRGRPGEA